MGNKRSRGAQVRYGHSRLGAHSGPRMRVQDAVPDLACAQSRPSVARPSPARGCGSASRFCARLLRERLVVGWGPPRRMHERGSCPREGVQLMSIMKIPGHPLHCYRAEQTPGGCDQLHRSGGDARCSVQLMWRDGG